MLPEETMKEVLALMDKGYTYQEAVKEIQSRVNVICDAFNSDFENTWDWDEWDDVMKTFGHPSTKSRRKRVSEWKKKTNYTHMFTNYYLQPVKR